MKRPVGITIIGILFIISGLWTGFEIVRDLFGDRVNLNLGVLMAPVGFGLIRGRSSSRGWAKFWIGSFSLVLGGLLIFYPFYGDSYRISCFGQPVTGELRHFYAVGSSIAFLLIARWMWKCLVSKNNAPFFDDFRIENAESGPRD
jgi:hypothetical protein